MRLTKQEIKIIKKVVADNILAPHKIYLFGSRTDDSKLGGDIDLLITTDEKIERPAWLSSAISVGLSMKLGEQKIDILLYGSNSADIPIYKIAKETGIEL